MGDNRQDQLEITLAHHEQQIQDLSDIVVQQQQDMDKLVKRLDRTQDKLKEVEATASTPSGEGISSATEKPPHY